MQQDYLLYDPDPESRSAKWHWNAITTKIRKHFSGNAQNLEFESVKCELMKDIDWVLCNLPHFYEKYKKQTPQLYIVFFPKPLYITFAAFQSVFAD